ncbi:COP9 signalosome complex subunit 8 [Microtus ochrogaster]|uniref:COP9 signalosome complex subunit 8 n=1 Tax=Microtus ochrogaster TaxID=79684 RepID=A0A8J6GF38_MICOH|nr:COP9 signalosome complex subunit 8 [Microtus ochrogaster]
MPRGPTWPLAWQGCDWRADSAFSFGKLWYQCENQELGDPEGIATPPVYDDFTAFVGLPVEEAVKGVLEQGWQADSATRMVLPRKPASGTLDVSFNRFLPLSEPTCFTNPQRAAACQLTD